MANLKALNWKMIWGIPAGMALVVLIFFTLFFKEPQAVDDPKAELNH